MSQVFKARVICFASWYIAPVSAYWHKTSLGNFSLVIFHFIFIQTSEREPSQELKRLIK